MKKGLRWPTFLAAIVFLFALNSTVRTQEATGKIIGTVTDPQGAVVSGATVTVTNTGVLSRQISRETTTNDEGAYQVFSLPIETYQITIERQGFKKFVSVGSKLEINQVLRVNAVLEVGSTAEIVNVVGQAASVETVNPTLGHSV